MPFLHYETDDRREEMAHAIKNINAGRPPPEKPSRDYMLVEAYLHHTPSLHPRRTLDQFFYHGIDTTIRDTDQVIQKYCRKHKVQPKVFMVDQLWLWILGRGEDTPNARDGDSHTFRSCHYVLPRTLGPTSSGSCECLGRHYGRGQG
jgi:hypothetical protein